MRDDQKTKAELGSGAGGKKPIKEAEKLRARKAKLERVSSELTKRKKAEQGMHESEQKYQALVEQSLQGIIILQDFQIIFANPTAAKIAGLTVDDVLALSPEGIKAFIPAEERATVLQRFEDRLAGKPVQHSYELRLMRQNGGEFWLDVFISQIEYLSKFAIQVAFIDITERKKAEEALAESEKKYRELVETSLDMIFVLDVQGNFTFTNRAWTEHIGYSCDEANKMNGFDLVHPDDLDELKKRFANVIKGTSERNVEFRSRTKKGNYLSVLINGSPIFDFHGDVIGVLGAGLDITERKKTEEALQQSEERLKILFESAPDAIYLIDLKGNFVDGNKTAEEIVGYTREELIGKNFVESGLLSQEQVPKAIASLEKNAMGEPTGPDEFTLTRKDGSCITVEIRTFPVRIENQTLVLGIARDITERKHAEQEREATIELLHLLNATNHIHELMKLVTTFLKDWSDCEAVGIRLQEGEDFPYFETSGFPEDFVLAESKLCSVNELGKIERDSQGRPYLECMCGNVISDHFDPSKPFFTEHGSFWTNSTTEMLAGTTEADRMARTRNRCNTAGYESVALVPLRVGKETFGLLQFNDKHKGRFTPEKISLLERLADNLAIGLAQRRAEKALRESQQSLVRAQQIAHIGDWDRDFVENTVKWSEELYRIFGVSPDDFEPTHKRFLNLVHPDDRELVGKITTNATSGKQPLSVDYRIVRPDGSECAVHSQGEVHTDNNGQVSRICGTVQDITERKRAEEALSTSEERYRAIFEQAADAIVLIDAETGELLEFNDRTHENLGYTREEFRKLKIPDFEVIESSEEVAKHIEKIVRKGRDTFETKHRTKDGRVRDVLVSSRVISISGRKFCQSIWRDVSERKKAEEALTESEENYHSIFDTANDAIFIHDLKDGTILDVNEKMLEMYGFANKKEIVGSFVGKLSSAKKPYTVEDAGKWVRKAIKEGPQLFEWHAKDKKGRLFWVEVNLKKAAIGGNDRILAIVRDITKRKKTEEQIAKLAKFPAEDPNPVLRISGRGTVVYANKASANLLNTWDCRVGKSVTNRWNELVMDSLSSGQSQQTEVKCDCRIFSLTFAPVVKANYVNVYGHDITERKKAEGEIQELNKYREQMAQAEQLASVGTLSASLAHELTQPLTVVRLSIENSLAELEKRSCPATVVEDLKEGLSGVSSIASIVNRFRNFARRTSETKVAEVDLKAVAERIVKLLDESAWRAKVTLQVEGMDKLPPIYSHEKDLERLFFSLVENAIQAADGKKSRQVIISGAVIDEHIELQFSDNCGGIAPENLDKIFEPFFTTKSVVERTGLGLCVVERIVSQFGGKVRVESKLGKGSTFFVTLPIKGNES